ncbi:MAG: membrane protein insertion efficiency factor YidD [Chitinophagaceae bacterium]
MTRKYIISISLLIMVFVSAKSQGKASDADLLRSKGTTVHSEAHYSRPGNDGYMMEVQQSSFFAKYNPVSLLLKGTMYTYQHVISPQLSRSCAYEITCSNFSKQSIKEYGIVKGVFISADRILRCNRIGVLDVAPLDFNDVTGTISDSPKKYR